MQTNSTTQSRLIKYVDAIAEACAQEMSIDEKVFVYGLDVDDHKAIQGSTAGLLNRFGSERVFSTPLSEDAMTGFGIGAAMAGFRPIHVHIRMDFVLLAMNQLVNMAAKTHYMYNGQVNVPIVIRAMIGRSWGQGAQHSQALHSMFMHVPGLKVVAPSNAYDAKGLLISSIRDNNPVIFMEHRLLCNQESYVPHESYEWPIGKGRLLREGADITIVGISHMVIESLRASSLLEENSVSCDVIDPISLRPLDIQLIVASVRKTKRLLVVDNGWITCGAAGEIILQVLENCAKSNFFDVNFARVGFADTPCPTTRSLEDLFYPSSVTIARKAAELIGIDIHIDESALKRAKEIEDFKGPF
jgi:pyruvate dehydrogenase E1 component beta subunit